MSVQRDSFTKYDWNYPAAYTLSVWIHFGMRDRKAGIVNIAVLILCFLFRILQIAVCSCESQASFQFGVQRLSLCPSSEHTVGTHPQTSALYLLLLHNRRKVQSRNETIIYSRSDFTHILNPCRVF